MSKKRRSSPGRLIVFSLKEQRRFEDAIERLHLAAAEVEELRRQFVALCQLLGERNAELLSVRDELYEGIRDIRWTLGVPSATQSAGELGGAPQARRRRPSSRSSAGGALAADHATESHLRPEQVAQEQADEQGQQRLLNAPGAQ